MFATAIAAALFFESLAVGYTILAILILSAAGVLPDRARIEAAAERLKADPARARLFEQSAPALLWAGRALWLGCLAFVEAICTLSTPKHRPWYCGYNWRTGEWDYGADPHGIYRKHDP